MEIRARMCQGSDCSYEQGSSMELPKRAIVKKGIPCVWRPKESCSYAYIRQNKL